jgi:dTMP kinase
LAPDLTILLDVSPEIGLRRASGRGGPDRFEQEKLDFHQRVREKYLELAQNDPDRIKVVGTDTRGVEDIQDEIRRIVEGIMK